MNTITGRLSIAAFVALGLFTVSPAASAAPTHQEVSGEVVRVTPQTKQVVLNVYDSQRSEEREVTIRVDDTTRLEGVDNLSELQVGQQVRVESKKNWFNQWVAQRLVYAPPARASLSPVETSKLHEVEKQFAHGEIGDVEYETKRQALQS